MPRNEHDDPSKLTGITLDEILADRDLLRTFRNYLITELSHENLDFWLSVRKFKTNRTETGKNCILLDAKIIYHQFIEKDSMQEINVECNTIK
jgi:hypothetical protein